MLVPAPFGSIADKPVRHEFSRTLSWQTLTSPPPMPLVGRSQELAALSAALDAARRGHGSVHFVVGEGGVGKTRVITEVTTRAASKGLTRIIGRANPVERGIPYALLGDAFVPLLRSMPASVLQVLARGSVAEFSTMFPALRGEGLAPGPTDDVERKPRLFDSFARFVQRLAQREPLLITLENLHWADPSSLELFHFLARSATAHPIIFLCSYDETQRDANPELRTTEQSLRSLDALRTHRVAPFTREETHELLRRQFSVAGETVAEFVERLHGRTLGNAFFIEETLEMLVGTGVLSDESGHWTGWDLEQLALPRTVRDAIAARLDRLPAESRAVATIAAVAGAQVRHALIEEIANLEPEALLAAIDALRRDRIVVETDVDRELGYEFTHPLLRDVLYSDLSRARARALHGEIADAMERSYGDGALSHADAIALHFLRAEAPKQMDRALKYFIAAGRSALDRGANREATELLDAALAASAPAGHDAETAQIASLLARARQRLGDFARAAELIGQLAAAADARNDAGRVATYEWRLGVIAFLTGRYDDAVAHYNRGLAAAARAGDDVATARLRLARSADSLAVGRATDALADIEISLAIAERIGDPGLLSAVHHALQLQAVWQGPADAARRHGALALDFATQAQDRAAAWNAEWAMSMHAGLTGDSRGTAEHLKAASALADELRSPVNKMWTAEVEIEYRSGVGEWDAALAIADRTIADARAFSQHVLLPRLLVWSSIIRFARGDVDLATAQMEEAWALSGADRAGTGAFLNVHAVVPAHVARSAWHFARNEYREALAVAEAGLAIADRTGYVAWAIHRLMPMCAEASLWIQDWERVDRYGDRLRRLAEQLGHPLSHAWADACFALKRMLQGDKPGSIRMLENAALALEAIPFVEHAARLRRKLADSYYESGDTPSAVRELRRIHDVFVRLSARPALDDVRNKMRALGVRPPSRSASDGAGALTAREVEIARLVAERKSNKEIGASLDISARTVGTHLSNIFGKLGVDSRGALTDLVREGALDALAPTE
jgi:DNA-binding CsgD family transcriptional regulator/tetratricopeptide (TPR) repeat protein